MGDEVVGSTSHLIGWPNDVTKNRFTYTLYTHSLQHENSLPCHYILAAARFWIAYVQSYELCGITTAEPLYSGELALKFKTSQT